MKHKKKTILLLLFLLTSWVGVAQQVYVSVENKNSSVIDSCWINVKDDKDALIGKIVLITKPTIIREYKLIFIKSDTTNFRTINQDLISNELNTYLNNNSYNQAFVKWEMKSKSVFNMLSRASIIKSKIIDDSVFVYIKAQYKLMFPVDNNMHYVFVFDRPAIRTDLGGLGEYRATIDEVKRKPLRLIIFYNSIKKYTTYAHELGHNLSLDDIVTQYPSIGYYTQNIMDYVFSKNMFWYWQIKMIYFLGTNKHN